MECFDVAKVAELNRVHILKGSFIQYVRKIFWKTNISYTLTRICTCVYQGVKNVSFSENFENGLNKWSLMRKESFGLYRDDEFRYFAKFIGTKRWKEKNL